MILQPYAALIAAGIKEYDMREGRKDGKMIIYICSQMRGLPPYTKDKYNKNLKKAAEYCRKVAADGYTPIAPHLFFAGFLDDQNLEERADGIRMGMELLEKCDEVWVFGAEEGISEGMKAEIERAREKTIPVRYR